MFGLPLAWLRALKFCLPSVILRPRMFCSASVILCAKVLIVQRKFTRFTLLLLCSPGATITCLTGSGSVYTFAKIYCIGSDDDGCGGGDDD